MSTEICRSMKIIDDDGNFHGCMQCEACVTAIKKILQRLAGKVYHLQHEKRVWEDRISQIRALTSPGISGPAHYKAVERRIKGVKREMQGNV